MATKYYTDQMSLEEVVVNNKGLILHIAKKLNVPRDEMDDAFSEGCIGLMKAYKNFDKDNGAEFITFAYTCISNQINMYMRRVYRHDARTISLNTVISNNEGNEITLLDIQSSNEELVELDNAILRDHISKAINSLSRRNQIIIKHLYGIGGVKKMKQQEIATLLRITQTMISRAKTECLELLKEVLIV